MTYDNSWRDAQFRQTFINKINDEVNAASVPGLTTSGAVMESHVYQKARNKDEYLGLVSRLMLHFRTIVIRNALQSSPDLAQVVLEQQDEEEEEENTGIDLRRNSLRQIGDALREAGSSEQAFELENRIYREADSEDDYRQVVTQLIDHLAGLGGRDEPLATNFSVGRDFLNRPFNATAGSVNRSQADEVAVLNMHRLDLDDKEEEEEQSDDERVKTGMCCICHDKRAAIAIVPCYHLCLCLSCSQRSLELAGLCPLCRGVIQKLQRIYI